jgi:5-(carboxyamino)imidazole ribonucleotide mutase
MPARKTVSAPPVGIIMGSRSDWPTLKIAAAVLEELGVAYEARVVSAHRTPERLYQYAKSAKSRGRRSSSRGLAGPRLPGMTASMTVLPVLGVPVENRALKGLDSLLSIAQCRAVFPSRPLPSEESGPERGAVRGGVGALGTKRSPSGWSLARQTKSVALSRDSPKEKRARR